ncbi:MAG: bifunctional diaminohydroxyphosphoribosylaminopyrimidine deaminase/5-amino-6-(5-phosphoribosylamino)uracil reductase RibD [Candidatus Goldiibacteriota bacterium]
MKNDELYMKRALEIAGLAEGKTSPNPMVGCVVVKNKVIISEGYHKKAGKPHAEIEALKKAGNKAKGASLYLNLEPCSHYGKTPPCTDAVIKAGIKKVYCAMKDPNPAVSGRGFLKLKKAGITVKNGIMKKEAKELNKVFIKNMKMNLPYVRLKTAISLDGRIALKSGEAKWITSKAARTEGRRLRNISDAVLVGINTVLADDPRLDAENKKGIKKVILDSAGRMPEKGHIFENRGFSDIYIFTKTMKRAKAARLKAKGVNVIFQKGDPVFLDEKKILKELYRAGVRSILVEGGGIVFTFFINKRLADEMNVHISNKLIGEDGIPCYRGRGLLSLDRTVKLENREIKITKDDIIINGKIIYG